MKVANVSSNFFTRGIVSARKKKNDDDLREGVRSRTYDEVRG
jgi:hypothetical protein